MVREGDGGAELLDTSKIKSLRERLDLSQQDAADLAGLRGGRQQWNSIETGARASITLETLGRISRALNVQPAELLLQIKLAKVRRSPK